MIDKIREYYCPCFQRMLSHVPYRQSWTIKWEPVLKKACKFIAKNVIPSPLSASTLATMKLMKTKEHKWVLSTMNHMLFTLLNNKVINVDAADHKKQSLDLELSAATSQYTWTDASYYPSRLKLNQLCHFCLYISKDHLNPLFSSCPYRTGMTVTLFACKTPYKHKYYLQDKSLNMEMLSFSSYVCICFFKSSYIRVAYLISIIPTMLNYLIIKKETENRRVVSMAYQVR